MPPRESKRLVDAAAGGSRSALDELFERSSGRLRRLLWLRAGLALRSAEVDDLMQEAWLEAIRRFDGYTYQGPDSFFRWLATIALHRLSNLQRLAGAQKRDPRMERPIDAAEVSRRAPTLRDHGPGPRTRVVGAETQQRLEVAMRRLSEADRDVIRMARIEGLPLPEIAARTGRTRNAVALQLSRALRKLKVLLGDEEAT